MNTIIFLYTILGIIILSYLIQTIKRCGWSIFSYASLYLFIFFIVAPLFSLFFLNNNQTVYKVVYFLPDQENLELVALTLLSICLGFLFYFIGYGNRVNIKIKEVSVKKIGHIKVIHVSIGFIFLLSLFGFFMYVNGFGSLDKAIANANLVRSGFYKDINKDTSHTFFFRFIFLALIPFLFFYFNKKYNNFIRFSVLITSLIIVFILYVFLSPGRQSIIDFFLILILVSIIKKNQILNYKIIILGSSIILILPIIESYFSSRSFDTLSYDVSIGQTFINEFGFPYFSLMYSIQENYDYFLFSDFISGIFGKFLPSSWSPGIKGSNYLNSYYMLGRDVKSIPPGLFAQGFYSLGLLGVILISYVTGRFFKYLDVIYRQIISLDSKLTFIYAFLITSSMIWIRTGLPANYFYNLTFLFMFLLPFFSYRIKFQ